MTCLESICKRSFASHSSAIVSSLPPSSPCYQVYHTNILVVKMRFIVLAASLPVAFAFWNADICNGVGGCIGVGSAVLDPFRCPDGSGITVPDFVTDGEAAGKAGAPTVSKADFPKTCLQGNVPGSNATFVVSFLDFFCFSVFAKL